MIRRPVAPPALHAAAQRLTTMESLDAPAKAVAKIVRDAIPRGPVKDAMAGTWLGHALHPLLTDTVIGTWTSALVLDVIGGRDGERAAEKLIRVGIAASLPTALTGAHDWADTEVADPGARRVGIVHGLSNVAALGLFTASLRARRRGRRGAGRLLALAGGGALTAGGHLGAHLTYGEGVGVEQTVFDPGPADWTAALPAAELAEGSRACVRVDGVPVLLLRRGGRVHALHDRCDHRGGPLHEGQVVGDCVECPWHGSRFRLEDGAVERGPATGPQIAYETRERDGRIEIRLPA